MNRAPQSWRLTDGLRRTFDLLAALAGLVCSAFALGIYKRELEAMAEGPRYHIFLDTSAPPL